MCHGKYVVFLNNDALLHRTAVDDLVREACACPSFDFFQPKILLVDAPDVINSTGISIHYCGFGVLRDAGKSASNCNTPQEISGVHGACFMARSEALRDIGPFDEVFFSFYEDTDLSWRALLKGMRILYVPPARVYHKWGQSWGTLSSAKIRLAERNRLILLFTNYEPGTLLALSFPIICAEIAMLGWLSKRRIVHAKIMAYADLICLREYLFVRRLMIQSTRRVGDLVLLGRFTTQLNQTRLTGPWISPLRSLLRLFEFLVVDRL
jgi:GT2 family glycosyltransferase